MHDEPIPTTDKRVKRIRHTSAADRYAMKAAADLGVRQEAIAQQFGVDQTTVSRSIKRCESTIDRAGEYAASMALRLAERTIRDADVDQALEVLDRLQVPGMTRRDSKTNGSTVVVAVGPGAFYGLPDAVSARTSTPIERSSTSDHLGET